jgi:putative ABC transport system permease protein
VQSQFTNPDTGEVTRLQMSSFVAGRTLAQDFPQIERRVYALNSRPVVLRGAEAIAVENGVLVDGPFFNVVQLPLVHGDARTALAQPGSVALSRTEALRLFGTDTVVGRTITVSFRGQRADRRITAVFRDIPRNSHMRLNYIERIDVGTFFADSPEWLTRWGVNSGWNYVALRPGTDPATLEAGFPAWERRNIPDQQFGNQRLNQGDIGDWDLVNVRDIHLGERQEASMSPGTTNGRSSPSGSSPSSSWAWHASTSPTWRPPALASAPAKSRCARSWAPTGGS